MSHVVIPRKPLTYFPMIQAVNPTAYEALATFDDIWVGTPLTNVVEAFTREQAKSRAAHTLYEQYPELRSHFETDGFRIALVTKSFYTQNHPIVVERQVRHRRKVKA